MSRLLPPLIAAFALCASAGAQAGRMPTEQELREALEKAGVEWDAEKYAAQYVSGEHDEL